MNIFNFFKNIKKAPEFSNNDSIYKKLSIPSNINEFREEHYQLLKKIKNSPIKSNIKFYNVSDSDIKKFISLSLKLDLIKESSTYDILKTLKKEDLINILKNKQLKVAGKKEDLIKRIIDNYNDNEIKSMNFYNKIYVYTEKGKDVVSSSFELLDEKEYNHFINIYNYVFNKKFSEAYKEVCKKEVNKFFQRGINIDWKYELQYGLSNKNINIYKSLFEDNFLIRKEYHTYIITCAIVSDMLGSSSYDIARYYIRYTKNLKDFNNEYIQDLEIKIQYIFSYLAIKQNLAEYDNNQKYEFSAYEDSKICPICKKLNGKHFKASEAKIGINCPPMHEGCRCSIYIHI